jgi:hypothetical protein
MRRALIAIFALALAGCSAPAELTEEKAREILAGVMFEVEPVYAEVPQTVRWSPDSPRDEYDEKAVRTLRNLEREGLVTLAEEGSPGGSYALTAKTTQAGFSLLGTVPSARGPAFRARICEKKLDGMTGFVRHPSDPTIASAEVVWHYENPTRFYEMFETKIDKPLGKPFASLVSFRWEKGTWHFGVIAPKVEPGG